MLKGMPQIQAFIDSLTIGNCNFLDNRASRYSLIPRKFKYDKISNSNIVSANYKMLKIKKLQKRRKINKGIKFFLRENGFNKYQTIHVIM